MSCVVKQRDLCTGYTVDHTCMGFLIYGYMVHVVGIYVH